MSSGGDTVTASTDRDNWLANVCNVHVHVFDPRFTVHEHVLSRIF
jgi:hypothetical protein